MKNLSRCIGQFSVSMDMLRYEPELLANIFSMLRIVPVRCEHIFELNEIQYVAICKHFREIPIGYAPIKYNLEYELRTDGFLKSTRLKARV